MKTKLRLLFIMFVMMLGLMSVNVFAEDIYWVDDGFEYVINEDGTTCSVVGSEDSSIITIPSVAKQAIEVDGEITGYISYTVTSVDSVGDHSHIIGSSNITKIIIPDTVVSIGDDAFDGCWNLIDISLPDSLVTIGDKAFWNCNVMTHITIPENVTSIGEDAFGCCFSLESVTIPNSVMSIGKRAFSGCTSLVSVTIPSAVTTIDERVFYNCNSLTNITISNGVETIGDYAFEYCSALTNITIPNSIKSIGDYAFGYCSSLTSIAIPDGVESIGYSSFRYCSGLTSISLPNSIKSYGSGIFDDCGNITNITFPGDVLAFSDLAWGSSGSLKNATILGGSTSLIDCLFEGCTSLESVTIPDSVTSIGSEVFWGCGNLTNVTIPDSVTSIGEFAFGECSSLTYITIPKGVKSIGEEAFFGCDSLISITIPKSVTSIGECAFDEDTVIYGYIRSYAQTYAKEHNLTFIPLDSCELSKLQSFICGGSSAFYDGKSHLEEIKDDIDIKCEGDHEPLVEGEDYTVTITNETYDKENDTVNAGTIKIVITGINGHVGTLTDYFTIKPHSLYYSTMSISSDSYTYDGTEKKPDVTVTNEYGQNLMLGKDYDVAYSDNIEIGTATVTVTGIRNYIGTMTKTFTIVDGEPEECSHSNTEIRDNKTATCAEEGYTGDTYCIDCGKKIASGQVIAKLTAHDYSWTVTKAATCTEKGSKTGTCTVCGETKTEEIATIDHNWNVGEVTKAATCTEKGTKTYTCTVCGETKTEEIAATGHNWNVGEVTKAATCTEKGSKTYTCTACGETKTEEIAVIDHSYGNWTVTKAATCTEAGTQTRTCSVCGNAETQAIAATGHKPVLLNQVAASYAGAGYTGDTYCSVCGTLISRGQATSMLTLGVPALQKLKAAKKAIVVSFIPSTGSTGIQVQYSLKKNMAKAKTKTVSGTSVKLSKLSKKKKYYVRIRSYVNTAYGPVYSAWSGIKSVKTK